MTEQLQNLADNWDSVEIAKQADKIISMDSSEYDSLPSGIKRFAKVHVEYNGFYSYTSVDKKKKKKVLIIP